MKIEGQRFDDVIEQQPLLTIHVARRDVNKLEE
jgi:hypothetical protein